MHGEPLTLRDHIAFYEKYGVLPFPISGGDGTDDTPDDNANPGGNKGGDAKKPVTFKDQETFEALLASRIAQAKRSWETDERPRIVEEVTNAVKADIEAAADTKAKEEAGQYKELYTKLLNVEKGDDVPKESRLFHLLQAVGSRQKTVEDTVKALVDDELKTLPDAMKPLLPTEYDLDKQLEWIRNAKKAAPSRTQGNNPSDPDPSKSQGLSVEDVVNELLGSIPYGAGRRGQLAGANSNGGSQ